MAILEVTAPWGTIVEVPLQLAALASTTATTTTTVPTTVVTTTTSPGG